MTNAFGVFGPIVASPTVEEAITNLAKEWLPTYINAVLESNPVIVENESRGVGELQYPLSFQNSYDFDNYLEYLLPSFIVVCSGTPKGFERAEGGEIGAWFDFEAAMLVEDQKEDSARKVAGVYASAIALMLEQRGSLGGLSADTLTHRLEIKLPVKGARTLALGHVIGETFVNNIMNKYAGPPIGSFPGEFAETPYEEPTDAYPEFEPVETVEVDVIGVDVDQDV